MIIFIDLCVYLWGLSLIIMKTKNTSIIGRESEIKRFQAIVASPKSEFLGIYGRRRVGKTYLIREYFTPLICFQVSGLSSGNTTQQLANFHEQMQQYFPNQPYTAVPQNWMSAFAQLQKAIKKISSTKKKVIFIDEMPWIATAKSDFMMALENFWNSWASARKDIILIACGSAASWIKNELINNHGGLHNRITQPMKIEPFTLKEVQQFFKYKKCNFNPKQLADIYMCCGGIPYYLEQFEKGKSVAQNIETLFFTQNAVFKNEYNNLFKSLFKNYEIHQKIIETLAKNKSGMNKLDICKKGKLKSGGTFTKTMQELEECGFISAHSYLDNKTRNTQYRLCDFFSAFHLEFMASAKYSGKGAWTNQIDNPTHRAWTGFAFESLCIYHSEQIKKALGISGILSRTISWQNKNAQVDMLIDRRDDVINLCEMKFSINPFTITKDYYSKITRKIDAFKSDTNTKKSVFFTMITSNGLVQNSYSLDIVHNEINLEALFE